MIDAKLLPVRLKPGVQSSGKPRIKRPSINSSSERLKSVSSGMTLSCPHLA